MTFIKISEELNYQFVPSPLHFLKLYMHYTYIYRTSYFDLIIGFSVNHSTTITNKKMFKTTRHVTFIRRQAID